MKVNFDLEPKRVKSVAFEGYKFTKSDDGFKQVEFSYPFDQNKEDCFIEIFKLSQDKHNNFYTAAKAHTKNGEGRLKINPGSNRIDLSQTFGIDDNQAFAYHFVLVDKDTGHHKVRIDAGDMINEGHDKIFNIVTPNKSGLSRGGAMKLVIIDSQHVGYVYNDQNKIVYNNKLAKRGQNGIKSITNKFGGTLAGLEHGLDNGEYDAYGRIISLPLFTDDDFTAHAYWNKNCMQMANSLGNINNYASFQRKMFAHGLNFVSDGAFVNEGLEGIHFKHLLKWGEESPYYNWFRASSIKEGPLSLGIFSKNKEFISHKIVNSPYEYVQIDAQHVKISNNYKYDKTKPTYIQFFDTRLVTDEERSDNTSLIKTYSKMSTPDIYDLHSHNDSIFPYAFEINPEIYNKNVKNLNEYNKEHPEKPINIASYKAAKILSKNELFMVDGKFESGFDTWDANPDIAKLNFVYSNADALYLKNLQEKERKVEMNKILRGNAQVQDYVVTSGKYWTQKTDDILRLYAAQLLKNIDSKNSNLAYDKIIKAVDDGKLPKSVKTEVSKVEVENVLSGFYNNKRQLSNEDKKGQILRGLMDMPLDSCEFGDNLVSVLASPMVSKRANKKAEVGLSRYEIFKAGNPNLPGEYAKTYTMMDKIYTNEMYDFANKVLDKVNETLPVNRKMFNGNDVSEYGKYVLPILTSEIAKYAVIKSIAPNAKITINPENGEISYDYNKLKEISLETVGINNPASVTDEAQMLLSVIRNGIKKLDSSSQSDIVKALSKTLKGTNLESFQLADLIIDKTQTGLDWRIDATKDIADVEAMRNKNTNFEYTWQSVINFWKRFTDGVISKNPNAYIVAEVTNTDDMYNTGWGSSSKKFPNSRDIIPKFLRETGITSIAEYSYFFRDMSKMFGMDFEDGSKFNDQKYLQKIIFEKMISFSRTGSLDSLRYAYTFIGNHDKPRALHCLAMDMGLFYCDLTYNDDGNHQNRLKAYKIIKDKHMDEVTDEEVRNYDFSGVSPKAVAMADALRPAFVDVLNAYKDKYPQLRDKKTYDKAFIPISKAIADLANGKFKGRRFDPDAFGIKPYDIAISMILEQAKLYNFNLSGISIEQYEKDVFEAVMTPALTKLLGIMKIMVALPGMPTLFDGDDYGTTGYDSKTKNMFVQGRQRNHDEWLNKDSEKYKEFLDKYKTYLNDTMKVRKNPKCNALNNGAIYTLPLNKAQTGELVPSILRQSTDGRMTISIFNPTGMHSDHRGNYRQNDIYVDTFYFTENHDNSVGIRGLREGTKFVNANNENDVYYTRIDGNGNYYLTRHVEGKDVPTPLHDTTLILYHVPEGGVPLTFTGSYMIKPNTKFVSSAYKTKQINFGKKLALTEC